MKFVHAADLHLDSPLRGLERYPGAPVEAVRSASRRACENLVELCIEEEASLLVIAGDLYDGDWRDYSTGLFFAEQMVKLREAGVKVAWIRGNHDAASKITKALRLPDNVRELPYSQPGTIFYDDLGIAVHGQGFATPRVEEDLVARFPRPERDWFNIGLLHTALEGRPGHASYAPCQLATLVEHGFDYWALGHVHQRDIVHEDPWVVFPGNLQGRHARELGEKGATVVEVKEGKVVEVLAHPLDVVRWQVCAVNLEEVVSFDQVVEQASRSLEHAVAEADGRLVAARIRLSGCSGAHGVVAERSEALLAELHALALDIGSVFVERLEDTTVPALDLQALRGQNDAVGMLAQYIDELRTSEQLGEFGAAFAELRKKLPLELEHLDVQLKGDDRALMLHLLDDVEKLLLSRILSREEDHALS